MGEGEHGDTGSRHCTAGEQAGESIDAPQLRLFVMALFFIFGGITSLNDVIISKLKELFTLNYTQAMLVQCFFTAYAVIGIPGARLVKRLGYMRRGGGAADHASRLRAIRSGEPHGDLRPVPARPVCAGERGGRGPGRGQSADLTPRHARDCTQPADLRPGVQLRSARRSSVVVGRVAETQNFLGGRLMLEQGATPTI